MPRLENPDHHRNSRRKAREFDGDDTATSRRKAREFDDDDTATSRRKAREFDDDDTANSRRQAREFDDDDTATSRRKAREFDDDDTATSRRQAREFDDDDIPNSRRQAREFDDDDTPNSRRQAREFDDDDTPNAQEQDREHTDEAVPDSQENTPEHADDTAPDSQENTPEHADDTAPDSQENTPEHADDTAPDSQENTPEHADDTAPDSQENTPEHADDTAPDSQENTPEHADDTAPDSQENTPEHADDTAPDSQENTPEHADDTAPDSQEDTPEHADETVAKPLENSAKPSGTPSREDSGERVPADLVQNSDNIRDAPLPPHNNGTLFATRDDISDENDDGAENSIRDQATIDPSIIQDCAYEDTDAVVYENAKMLGNLMLDLPSRVDELRKLAGSAYWKKDGKYNVVLDSRAQFSSDYNFHTHLSVKRGKHGAILVRWQITDRRIAALYARRLEDDLPNAETWEIWEISIALQKVRVLSSYSDPHPWRGKQKIKGGRRSSDRTLEQFCKKTVQATRKLNDQFSQGHLERAENVIADRYDKFIKLMDEKAMVSDNRGQDMALNDRMRVEAAKRLVGCKPPAKGSQNTTPVKEQMKRARNKLLKIFVPPRNKRRKNH